MSSGGKQLIINNLERAVSTDINRLQAFAGASTAEVLRWLYTTEAGGTDAGGVAIAPSGLASPLRVCILGGLQVQPQLGTTDTLVQPGLAVVVQPDAVPDADDSPVKYVVDPGITALGALLLTPNNSGATRVDVVECQVANPVVENDNRDIYNPATGLFTATAVDKATARRMVYRIRTGTPGGGFPGNAWGWLPLAVVVVPNATTSWDTCTVWDVRPLLSDMASTPLVSDGVQLVSQWGHVVADGAARHLSGIVEAVVLGRRVGGQLAPASVTPGYIDLKSANVQDPAFPGTNNRPWYLYLMTPFGLPRWARYTAAGAGVRRPMAPRGIPVVSQTPPLDLSGIPFAAIALPTGLGLGGSSIVGRCVLAGAYTSALDPKDFTPMTFGTGWTRLVTDSAHGSLLAAPSSGGSTAAPVFTLAPGVTHPANASALRLRLRHSIAGVPGNVYTCYTTVKLKDQNDVSYECGTRQFSNGTFPTVGGGLVLFSHEFELPLPPALPSGVPLTYKLPVNISVGAAGGFAYSDQELEVMGWTLGR